MADGNSVKGGKDVSSAGPGTGNTGANRRGFTTYPNQANGPPSPAAAPTAGAGAATSTPNAATAGTSASAAAPTQAIVVSARSMRPLVVGAGALAAGSALVYAIHRWRQGVLAAADQAASLPGSSGTPGGGQTPAPPAGPGQTAPPANAEQPPIPPPADSTFWGTAGRGEQYRALFTKIEQVTGMPLRLYLCVVANCEAEWSRTARNKSVVEVAASRRGIDNGTGRGNPKPKYADSIREAGSGGLFGALAPYVAWTGYDEDFMPYLNEDWKIIEDPIVAVICAAKYYQRIVGGGRYPVFANPAAPAPIDNYRVRLGWARPATLKDDPTGKLAQAVRGRFDEDLVELGLKITDLPPPNADKWPGLKAVVEAMKGFPVTWK